MSLGSRRFWLRERSSGASGNADTVCIPRSLALPRLPMRELFLTWYPDIRRELVTIRRPGASVLALDASGLQAVAHLSRKPSELNAVILGRHSDAELALRSDPTLSLRHLALLVPPGGPEDAVTVRALDLRSASGLFDERGQRHRGLELDGPAFLECGPYAILVVPASDEGPSLRLPEDPLEAWGAFPPREFARGFDRTQGLGRALAARVADRVRRRRGDASTLIRILPGPRDLHERLLKRGEEPLGQLLVRSDGGSAVVSIGSSALRRGVLLGRSNRCQASRVLGSPYISRVHLLVIAVAGRVYAVDTASHNGVLGGGASHRVAALDSGEALSLASVASVEWRFVH